MSEYQNHCTAMSEGERLIEANIPGAKPEGLPELLEGLRAAVCDPSGLITFSADQLAQIVRHQPRDLTEYRLTRIAEWSQPRFQIDRRFVSLTLLTDREEQAQGVRWAPERGRFTDLRDVVKERPDDPALVLLGAPGSGKSTLLRRFQLDTATDTLRAGDDRVSFFVSLNRYRIGCDEPREWLSAEWMRLYPDLPRLDVQLARGKVVLLLDAINEMPHADMAHYHERIGPWRDFIQSIVPKGNRALFSCRSLDYSSMLSSKNLRVPQVVVQPMDDGQIQSFLKAYLPGRADHIWRELDGTPQLGLFRTPFFLKMLCEQLEVHGAVPKGRAGLFAGSVRQALERETTGGNPLFEPDSLLTGRDRRKLALHKWRTPFELPEEGSLVPSLSGLAYAMQETGLQAGGAQMRIAYRDACGHLGSERPKDILKAGVALHVLDEDAGHDEVLFFHQLLQEFFAARRLALDPRPELVRVEWRAGSASPPLEQTIAGLADSDPLPLLPQTGWEETTLLGSVMAPDPEAFVRELMEVNLALAGRSAAMPELAATPPFKQQMQQALIVRTQDAGADLRARIAAGLALGTLGDPRLERCAGPHGDYLLTPLATIPAGEYPIGSDEGFYEDEAPAHTVPLHAFQIGMFPVTNAEYALFIASGGYEEERWWKTEAASAWRRGQGSTEGSRQLWRDNRKLFQSWPEEHLRDMAKQKLITLQQSLDWIAIRNWPEDSFESWLEEGFPSGRRFTEPRFWRDESLNNPSQPVAGICWHEARAYCAWLSAQAGREFRLPTEAEFEAAASGPGGRRYPYGDTFDSERSNTFENHILRTTPVGIFRNATPEGVLDLSGNVWTWTSSAYEPYPYRAEDGREDESKDVPRVGRGGSWRYTQLKARAAARNDLNPTYRNRVGFRVVGVVPSP
ncbi:MAG TPA: SUMF1/EgtB/PvdO family nonheme iron enzyme [Terracidiphilus sp.]|nr:SUMF1/EgtB/PvdO family nonheme iron enzyme [Terracidiphilus sp.]